MIFAVLNFVVAVWMIVMTVVYAVAGDYAWAAAFLLLAGLNAYVFVTNPEVRNVKR